MASKVAAFSMALALGVTFCVTRCSRVAYADEYLVADDYATRSDVSRLDGSVSALTGSVSSGLSDMQDDVSNMGRDVTTLVDGQSAVKSEVESVKGGVESNGEGIDKANASLDAQGEVLAGVAADVRTLREVQDDPSDSEVTAMSVDDLLALVPADASEQITDYMQYPFLMGMASGIVAYVISLVAAGVYRLLGFK